MLLPRPHDGGSGPVTSGELPEGCSVHPSSQTRDGFVGWGPIDEALRTLGAAERSVVYQVFKGRRLAGS